MLPKDFDAPASFANQQVFAVGIAATFGLLWWEGRRCGVFRTLVGNKLEPLVTVFNHELFTASICKSDDKAVVEGVSVGERGLFRQSQVASATASHFPKSTRFSIVTFAREAKTIARSLGYRDFNRALSKVQKTPRKNGSEITEGIQQAVGLLASHKGAKRIILLSDNKRRLTTPKSELKRVLGRTGALLHIVEVPPHRKEEKQNARRHFKTRLREREKSFWSPGVRASGGIVARVDSPDWQRVSLRENTLHLMRPTQIKELRFKRAPKGRATFRISKEESARLRSLPDLGEGEQLRLGFGVEKNEIAPTLIGRLWSKEVSWKMPQSDDYSKVSGGFLLTLGATQWSPFETMTLAKKSHVVSSVTSLIAAEPGARPSREGFGSGGGSASGRGFGGGAIGPDPIRTSQMVMTSWNQVLKKERESCLRSHKGAKEWTFYFVLQRGLLEIVDVQPLRNPSQEVSPLATCLYEAIWNYRLDGSEPEPDIVFLSSTQ